MLQFLRSIIVFEGRIDFSSVFLNYFILTTKLSKFKLVDIFDIEMSEKIHQFISIILIFTNKVIGNKYDSILRGESETNKIEGICGEISVKKA